MLGAIFGDICGSIYESTPVATVNFTPSLKTGFITDDTILTLATAEILMSHSNNPGMILKKYYNDYPMFSYGEHFVQWAEEEKPGNSSGNGAAMRTSPVGWFYNTLEEVMLATKNIAKASHNSKEAIVAAQAVARSIFLLRNGATKTYLQKDLEKNLGYTFNKSFTQTLRESYYTAQAVPSVAHAIHAFLVSTSLENAVYKAILLQADADTQANIAGALAEAYYPNAISAQAISQIKNALINPPLIDLATQFYTNHVLPKLPR